MINLKQKIKSMKIKKSILFQTNLCSKNCLNKLKNQKKGFMLLINFFNNRLGNTVNSFEKKNIINFLLNRNIISLR